MEWKQRRLFYSTQVFVQTNTFLLISEVLETIVPCSENNPSSLCHGHDSYERITKSHPIYLAQISIYEEARKLDRIRGPT